MKTCLQRMTVGCVLMGAGLAMQAGPIQRADVPAQPAWVLHLDVDGLRSTGVGQHILTELNKPEVQAKLAVFETLASFDPRTALHGLTLFGTGSAPEDGVLLVYADFDSGRLETLAKAADDHRSNDYKGHTIHNWVDQKKKAKGGVRPRTYAAIHANRVVVFGQKELRVAQALDVLDKTSGSLSTASTFPQLGAVGQTGFVQAAARKLDLPDSDPNAALMRLSKMVRMQMGESQGTLTTTFTLEAKDDEVAGHMLQVAQGLVALAKLQKEKPESARIAEATTVKQEGAQVVVQLSLTSKEVVEAMKAGAARKAAEKAAKAAGQ